uniref:Uncharacterized protein n=1 Tax=Knipowitschia caucasica TaxID=637954 RepID=A0AAV2KS01_KNICA
MEILRRSIFRSWFRVHRSPRRRWRQAFSVEPRTKLAEEGHHEDCLLPHLASLAERWLLYLHQRTSIAP